MQNNHTQNCKGSGCWLQRIVELSRCAAGEVCQRTVKTNQGGSNENQPL